MSRQKRRMSSIPAIFDYWSQRGWRGSKHHCMECGVECRPERAHIMPRYKGGSDSAENLVLVCHSCHVMTDGRTKETWEEVLLGGRPRGITFGTITLPFEFFIYVFESKSVEAKKLVDLLLGEEGSA